MNWLTGSLTAHGCKYQIRRLSWILGITAVFCSGVAQAETDHQVNESWNLSWIGDDVNADALNDSDLSFVNGKGAEQTVLDAGGKLAIILWDEGGSDNRRGTNHDVNSASVVHLTVLHK